jgi:hypothetical protein
MKSFTNNFSRGFIAFLLPMSFGIVNSDENATSNIEEYWNSVGSYIYKGIKCYEKKC